MSKNIHTFGCRLNLYESEVIKGFQQDNQIVINTCAVTNEAVRQARQSVRRLARENPEAQIIVTGCAAQLNPAEFADMDGVSKVLGNADKLQASSYLDATPVQVSDIMQVKETAHHLIDGFDNQARAFVEIQQGCNHRCTFCIIPFGRGNARSTPAGILVDHIKKLVENGYNEIVLTGVDITSYGEDLPGKPTLTDLIKRILKLVPDLPRLRLSSIDPAEVYDDFFELFQNDHRIMPHLHISMQAGDDLILKRMKRRHLSADIIKFCENARKARPDVVFGADIIAGFPTETDQQFETGYNLVKQCNITHLHVFPYSERDGTPAAKMPRVAGNVRKERAAKLRKLNDIAQQNLNQSLNGTTRTVVVENNQTAHTPEFAKVHLSKDYPLGSLQTVQLAVKDGGLDLIEK